MNLIQKISNWFHPKNVRDYKNQEFEWCIVGNIIDKHYWGEEKIIKSGTKHFRPGAKVYCMPEFGGIAHETIRVLGKPRKKNRMINVIINTKMIKNFRVQKVYNQEIQSKIGSHSFYWGNRNSRNELKNLNEMIGYLESYTEEINL